MARHSSENEGRSSDTFAWQAPERTPEDFSRDAVTAGHQASNGGWLAFLWGIVRGRAGLAATDEEHVRPTNRRDEQRRGK